MRGAMIKESVVALLTFMTGVCASQTDLQESIFLSIDDGLSQSSVHAIAQDCEGFMWFGTEDGLNRYDGYRFMVFHSNPGDSTSLSDNSITSLATGKSGILWIGTKRGVDSWDPKTESLVRLRDGAGDAGLLQNAECTAVFEDAHGAVWIGTANGLIRYDPLSKRSVQVASRSKKRDHLPLGPVQCIYEDAAGRLWIGAKEGIGEYQKDESVFGFKALPGNEQPWTMCDLNPETLLVGTSEGSIYVFDKSRASFKRLPARDLYGMKRRPVWVLSKDKDDNLWVGSCGNGLFELSHDLKKWSSYNLYDNFILSLYESRSGIFWIGTGKGIHRISRNKTKFKYLAPFPADGRLARDVWSFCQRKDGSIWVGTNNGFVRYDTGRGSFSRSMLNGYAVYSMLEDHNGILWVGRLYGCLIGYDHNGKERVRFDRQKGIPGFRSLSDKSVSSLAEDQVGNLWIGTPDAGVYRLNNSRDSIRSFRHDQTNTQSLSNDHVSSILVDRSGGTWIGTDGGGVNYFDSKSDRFWSLVTQPGDVESLSSNRVECICEDSNGIIWIGTSYGLNAFDRASGRFTSFHKKDGLPSEVVCGIVEGSDGCLWLSTNRGISRFDPQKRSFRNYSKHDGLQSEEFNHGAFLRTRSGGILFGGINGFNSFFPENLYSNPFPPPIVFTEFKVFDRPVALSVIRSGGNNIELQYSENFFSIEFAALDYLFPAGNKYAYTLEGVDKDWLNCGTRRYVAYANLDPGDYTFRVRGSNSDDVWNMEGASIAIHIIPPFWQTWWFQAAVVALCLFSLGFVLHRRIAQLQRHTREQEERSRQILESQEHERKRIGASLHDSLGQDLLVIKNLAAMAQDARARNNDSRNHLDEISSLASHALAEVREISYDLRPHHLDQLGLTGALRSIISRVEASSHIAYTVEMDNLDNLLPPSQDTHFFRIVQEALNNIIKHSQATRTDVRIKREGESIVLSIRDNGVGFDPHKNGFGLSGMAERTRILGGSLEVQPKPGVGTSISVTVPLRNQHGTA